MILKKDTKSIFNVNLLWYNINVDDFNNKYDITI